MDRMESEVKHQIEKAKHGEGDPRPYETPELTVYGKVETETLQTVPSSGMGG